MPFTLGLDLDQVVGDYIGEFAHHVARAFGIPVADLPEPVSWDFAECGWGIRDRDHFLALQADAVRDGIFRSMPVFPGASDALWRLSHSGVDIRIITHRLVVKNLHATAAADTVAWLDRHRIPYRDVCFVGGKSDVAADIYLDDAPHNVRALRAAGRDIVIFDAPYNRDLHGERVHNWVEAEALVADRYQAWLDLGGDATA